MIPTVQLGKYDNRGECYDNHYPTNSHSNEIFDCFWNLLIDRLYLKDLRPGFLTVVTLLSKCDASVFYLWYRCVIDKHPTDRFFIIIFKWQSWKEISNSLPSSLLSYSFQLVLFELISLTFKKSTRKKVKSLLLCRYIYLIFCLHVITKLLSCWRLMSTRKWLYLNK